MYYKKKVPKNYRYAIQDLPYVSHDNITQFITHKRRKYNEKLFLLIIFAVTVLFIGLMPRSQSALKKASVRILELPGIPIIVALEEDNNTIVSAYIRTPAGARNLRRLEGLSYVSSTTSISQIDQDTVDDLLWRLTFVGSDGTGLNLWMGMTTYQPKVFIATTPFRHTRWDVLPAKINTPNGTALYIAPAAPFYSQLDKQFSGTDCYSFIYTMRLTPEGINFVPVPSVYRQLSILLHAGMQGESSSKKRFTYLKMLTEFNRLAEGKAPQAETLVNFPIERIDTLTWKK